ncbi:MAG: nucleotidyltransferase domain-containing protein, partial [Solobacterium sp.]|nr:nucleotidyltransferase domain-containing protein [Solobacterium sp.]
MDFAGIPDKEEYAFLKTHPRLGKRIILLGVSGSHGYGTQRQGSDIDLRGIAFNSRSDLLGLTSFDQYEDCQTDTVIYSFMKAVRLFLDCNPNMIEMLGLDDDRYLCMNEAGRLLRDSRHLFLSKRAAASFGHYAQAQLRRLQNAIARDTLP